MPNLVQAAPAGRMVDTNVKLTPPVLKAIADADFVGVGRYVPLPGNSAAHDIDARELAAVMEAGLGLLLVQHVRFPHWDPRQHQGGTDAQAAVQAATAAGYLPGAHLFLDLEGIVPGTGTATIAFAESWATVVQDAGYLAGLYVGFDVPLSAQQLFDLHIINSYWSDAGPRQVAVRGFALKQHPEIQIAGVAFDPDTIQPDGKGETPIWMVAAPSDVG